MGHDEEMKENVEDEDDQENKELSEQPAEDGSGEDDSDDDSKENFKRKSLDEKNEDSPSKKAKVSDDPSEELKKNRFRQKLSKMSIEEIHRLKNQIGLKLFNQKMAGENGKDKNVEYKRDNKNRPREMS